MTAVILNNYVFKTECNAFKIELYGAVGNSHEVR